MSNYIVSWSNGGSQVENFLVSAQSFTTAAENVWSKKSFVGSINSIYSTNLSIDKEMGSGVYYIVMGNKSEFFITFDSWIDAKDWVYQTLGSNVDTIMYMGMQYLY